MPELKLNGNDLELDGEKVARVFDIVGTMRYNLEKAIERTYIDREEEGISWQTAYSEGWQDGYRQGLIEAMNKEKEHYDS